MNAMELAEWRALVRESNETVEESYAKQVFLQGHSECRHPLPKRVFLPIIKAYKEGMRDLHARFPDLKKYEPPVLSQEDANFGKGYCEAAYNGRTAAIRFADPADYDGLTPLARQFRAPRELGFKGVLAHEFGHHLSSSRVVSPSEWQPKLAAMLRARGLIEGPRGAAPAHMTDTRFNVLAGKQVRELGIGVYAGWSPGEFAAEAIAWRLHPDYGQTEEVPRMPPALEEWVHECFPFLDNGSIPQDSVPFNPGSIVEPAMVNGELQWMRRDAFVTAPRFVSLNTENRAIRAELTQEVEEAVNQGYAKDTNLRGHAACPHPLPERTFLQTVKAYNEGMRDLHERFPALKDIEPPVLSQEDPNYVGKYGSEGGRLVGLRNPRSAGYAFGSGAVSFADPADIARYEKMERVEQGQWTRGLGFKGTLAYGYGLHLSSHRGTSKTVWLPKLENALSKSGLLRSRQSADPAHANQGDFSASLGEQVRSLGTGFYPGMNEHQFAAEAIAWRMHPDYGRTEEAPKMPPGLEAWVHECFPFLDNGQIPANSGPFDPGSILEQVMVDGEQRWIRRDKMAPPQVE